MDSMVKAQRTGVQECDNAAQPFIVNVWEQAQALGRAAGSVRTDGLDDRADVMSVASLDSASDECSDDEDVFHLRAAASGLGLSSDYEKIFLFRRHVAVKEVLCEATRCFHFTHLRTFRLLFGVKWIRVL